MWLCAVPALAQSTLGSKKESIADSGSAGRTQSKALVNADKTKQTSGWLQPGTDPENRLVSPFLKHIAEDQKQFWLAPSHFKVQELKWIAPLTGLTAAFIASDSWWSRQVNPAHEQTSLHISDYGAYSLIGLGGASFLLGHVKGDDHLSEAGLLSGEAAINATGIAYLLKEITQRQRPLEGNGNGNFFSGGASFPSEHSAIAWSIASVWAHEYPGWLSQAAAYGLATTISATRVTAKQHFPSDVIVGGALGWYFGRQVYRAHHDPEVGGSGWGNFLDEKTGEKTRNPDNMASPYVPMDNWVYPLFDRLIGLGYIHSAHTDIRPWTRMECARLVEEASDSIEVQESEGEEAEQVYNALKVEFRDEIARRNGAPNVGATLESIYTRSTEISGPVLHDGYHFGQTVINDYGRPYGNGFNDATGVSARAVAGPFSFYVRGEYQHAPAVPSDPASALQAAAVIDEVPFLPSNQIPQINRLRLLDATATFQISNVEFSFGQQSLWLGPSSAGPFLFSENSEPIPMVRIASVSPHEVPFLSRILGPVKTEFFLGRLSGQDWESFARLVGPALPSQPWLHGAKVSFNPTANFEFGMGFTAQFGGTGNPFTWHNFLTTFYKHSGATSPAKRLSAFDFSYRLPGIRKWVTLYTDSMVVDEYSPIGSTRPQINPGVFFPQLPKIPKMQVRLEGVTTVLNIPPRFGPGQIYFDSSYRSGYTNNGNLIGDWIGRAGRGEQAWVTYSLTPRNLIQFCYRHNNVNPTFLEGGHLRDLRFGTDFVLRKSLELSSYIQYETWRFPILSPMPQSNVTASVGITYWPRGAVK